MLECLKKESNRGVTENGGATYKSSLSHCLDLFATIGAMRHQDEAEIISRFVRAYAEDKNIAVRILFFARDIKLGLGERRVFRILFRWLALNSPETARENLDKIAEYGRFDDILVLAGTPLEGDMVRYIRETLREDTEAMEKGEEVSLLGKWLPSVNASNPDTKRLGKRLARKLGMTEGDYRKLLVSLRGYIRIIENSLREKDYTFEYENQPSKALLKYRKAFIRNDRERYIAYLEKVSSGEVKLNTDTVAPYEIVRRLMAWRISEEEVKSLDATWKSLKDYGSKENAIAVIDGSGSMYGGTNPLPITIAMSLGIYFAERNKGAFKNHFITFSENPQLVEIKGETILDKVRFCMDFNEVANTNIQKVYELILNTAIKNDIPQADLPDRLYIISDMEFDECADDSSVTNFEYAKKLYEEAGYKLPEIVFWNVDSRNNQQPVTMNEQGVLLVSGSSLNIFNVVSMGEVSEDTPYELMLRVLDNPRYSRIVAHIKPIDNFKASE